MMHEGLWRQVMQLDGPQTARRALCQFHPDDQSGRYVIPLLQRPYVVDVGKNLIFPQDNSASEPAGFTEQLCLLAYLIGAADQPLRHKLVKAETLASGEFFFRGIHEMPTDRLAETFGADPEKLYRAAEQFHAQQCDYGDASVEFLILPRVPTTIVIWRGDEEFAARASMLFDQTAGEQLALDALGAAANLTVAALIEAVSA